MEHKTAEEIALESIETIAFSAKLLESHVSFHAWWKRSDCVQRVKSILTEYALQESKQKEERIKELEGVIQDHEKRLLEKGREIQKWEEANGTLETKLEAFLNSSSEIVRLREENQHLKAKWRGVLSYQEDEGKAGCRYGDTQYDSLSAVYGYNICLSEMKLTARAALQPLERIEK